MELRPLDLRDRHVAADVLALQLLVYRHHSQLLGVDLPSGSETIHTVMGDLSEAFGLYDDGRLLAAIAYRRAAESIEITRLYVHPDRRREQLATRLYKTVCQAESSARRIQVSTYANNQAAAAFYRRQGFVEIASVDGVRPERRDPMTFTVWERVSLVDWIVDARRHWEYSLGLLVPIGLGVWYVWKHGNRTGYSAGRGVGRRRRTD